MRRGSESFKRRQTEKGSSAERVTEREGEEGVRSGQARPVFVQKMSSPSTQRRRGRRRKKRKNEELGGGTQNANANANANAFSIVFYSLFSLPFLSFFSFRVTSEKGRAGV